MNFLKHYNFYIFLLIVSVIGCKPKEKPNTVVPETTEPSITMQESIDMSQNWATDEVFRIDQYVTRHGWDAVETGTGIRYYIYEKGTGRQAKTGDVALIEYEIRLLDAESTLCYSSEESGATEFLIGMDNVETGLHEAITYLKEGDKAFIILPHFLAHGLVGDMNKIPPLSPVLYKINLLEVKDK